MGEAAHACRLCTEGGINSVKRTAEPSICALFRTPQHVECIGYLLSKGADPFSETEKGETCLHLAAKNAYTECLREILAARVSIGGGPPTRLADAVLPYTPPVKFVDMRNGEHPCHHCSIWGVAHCR